MKRSEGEIEVASELAIMRRLLALSIIEGKKQREQIRILSVAGLDRNAIAELLGTTPGTVSVEISNLRKEGILGGKKR